MPNTQLTAPNAQLAMTSTVAKPVGFLDLPAELRNRIYELHRASYYNNEHISWICEHSSGNPFAYKITRVSRQVRAETVKMFYHGADMSFFLDCPGDYSNAKAWLKLVHPDAVAAAGAITVKAWHSGCTCKYACPLRIVITAGDGEPGAYLPCKCPTAGDQGEKVYAMVDQVLQGLRAAEGATEMTKAALLEIIEAVESYT